MPATAITATMLYSLVSCPHRVTMDLFEDAAKRDPVNPFVELLWERGSAVERERMAGLGVEFVDLQALTTDEKARATREAMAAGAPLIYGGRIARNPARSSTTPNTTSPQAVGEA